MNNETTQTFDTLTEKLILLNNNIVGLCVTTETITDQLSQESIKLDKILNHYNL